LLAATRELLKTTSPTRLSLAEIARFAGVDRALIRYYYGNTDSLLVAATMEIWNELRQLSALSASPSATVQDKLQNWVRTLMHIMRDNPHFHQMMMQLVLSGKDLRAKKGGEKIVAARIQEIGSWLDSDERVSRLKIDPRFLFLALIGMCEQFFSSKSLVSTIFGEKAPSSELAQQYSDFIVQVVNRLLTPESTDTSDKRDNRPRAMARRSAN
jgi:TetR/AcrR family transcriptional regulator